MEHYALHIKVSKTIKLRLQTKTTYSRATSKDATIFIIFWTYTENGIRRLSHRHSADLAPSSGLYFTPLLIATSCFLCAATTDCLEELPCKEDFINELDHKIWIQD